MPPLVHDDSKDHVFLPRKYLAVFEELRLVQLSKVLEDLGYYLALLFQLVDTLQKVARA